MFASATSFVRFMIPVGIASTLVLSAALSALAGAFNPTGGDGTCSSGCRGGASRIEPKPELIIAYTPPDNGGYGGCKNCGSGTRETAENKVTFTV